MRGLEVRRSTKPIKKRYVLLLVSILMISISMFSGVVKAASFNYPGILESRYKVVDNLDTFYPKLDSYPFNEPGVKASSMTDLWGPSKSLTKYLGEVPESLAETDEGKKLRTMNGTKINGEDRPWSTQSGLEESDIVPNSKDLHIRAMAEAAGFGAGAIGWILYHLVAVINFLVTSLLNLLLLLKDIDMNMIFDTLNSGNKLRDTLNTLFLISPDGEISPFLVIMITIYIISLVGVIYKALKGEQALQYAIREFLFLMLASLIAGLALTSSSQAELSKWSVNLATTLSNEIVSSSTSGAELFKYDTGNPVKDSNMTQAALLEKPHVDNFIAMQFGYTVPELEIKDKNGNYTNNFGSGTEAAIRKTFGDDRDFSVDSGSGKVHNLGYYWWAANSNVDENDPIEGKGEVKSASNMRYLYIIDFLNNARAEAEANGETQIVNKIDKIMTKLWDPDWMSGFFTSLVLVVLKIALIYAFYLVVVFMSVGKIIISVGAFAVPILAALVLVQRTRSMAKKLLMTYVMGFVRYIVGLLMINLIISIVATLAMQGIGGILIAAVIAALLGKFVPNILLEINRFVAKNDAPFMHGLNRSFARYTSEVQANRSKFRRRRIEYDEDGNLVEKDTSLTGRIASGFSRKNKPIDPDSSNDPDKITTDSYSTTQDGTNTSDYTDDQENYDTGHDEQEGSEDIDDDNYDGYDGEDGGEGSDNNDNGSDDHTDHGANDTWEGINTTEKIGREEEDQDGSDDLEDLQDIDGNEDEEDQEGGYDLGSGDRGPRRPGDGPQTGANNWGYDLNEDESDSETPDSKDVDPNKDDAEDGSKDNQPKEPNSVGPDNQPNKEHETPLDKKDPNQPKKSQPKDNQKEQIVNKGKREFLKRKAKNVGIGLMQQTVTGRKIAENMMRNQNNNNKNKDDSE